MAELRVKELLFMTIFQKCSGTHQSEKKRDRAMNDQSIPSKGHWLVCPLCGGKTRIKVNEDTVLLNFPLFCPHCKKETFVGVLKLEMAVSV